MRLTRFTDNSLRTLIYLALNLDKEITISEVSQRCEIPRNHLVKVVHALSRHSFILTTRGRAGGMRLKNSAGEIKVGDVVKKMEGSLEVIKCFTPRCPISSTCQLRNVLDEAMEAFLAVLDNYSIADITKKEEPLRELLGIVNFSNTG